MNCVKLSVFDNMASAERRQFPARLQVGFEVATSEFWSWRSSSV